MASRTGLVHATVKAAGVIVLRHLQRFSVLTIPAGNGQGAPRKHWQHQQELPDISVLNVGLQWPTTTLSGMMRRICTSQA